MLVNATAMLQSAEKGHYGIGAFNTNNLEWASSILDAGEELQSPLIIQCTGGAAKWQTSFKIVADMVKQLVEDKNITVPVALHLDHGSYDQALACIEAGFTSVMYDGSHEADFETNLKRTAEIVKLAHSKGISVEAEVGGIGGTEDGVTSAGELADPEQCKAIADLGVDFLACGIGNIHGLYPADWAGLSFDRLGEIKALTGDLPLVLHGGTGIPVDQVQKAVSMGICKVNVNTDLQVVFAKATREYIEAGLSVLFAQFLKTGDSAELAALERMGGVDVALPARSFGFVWTLSDAQKDQMREVYAGFWRELMERASGYDVLVADELLDAINLGLVDLAEAVAWLRGRRAGLEVVLTGRDPAPELVELADYVSEVRKVKHPFDRGVAARRGIEY